MMGSQVLVDFAHVVGIIAEEAAESAGLSDDASARASDGRAAA